MYIRLDVATTTANDTATIANDAATATANDTAEEKKRNKHEISQGAKDTSRCRSRAFVALLLTSHCKKYLYSRVNITQCCCFSVCVASYKQKRGGRYCIRAE